MTFFSNDKTTPPAADQSRSLLWKLVLVGVVVSVGSWLWASVSR